MRFAFFSLTRPSFFAAGVCVFTLGLRVNVWNKKAPCTGDCLLTGLESRGRHPVSPYVQLSGSGSGSRPPRGLPARPHPASGRLTDALCPDGTGPSASAPVQAGPGCRVAWGGSPLALAQPPERHLPSWGLLDFSEMRRELVSPQAWFSYP